MLRTGSTLHSPSPWGTGVMESALSRISYLRISDACSELGSPSSHWRSRPNFTPFLNETLCWNQVVFLYFNTPHLPVVSCCQLWMLILFSRLSLLSVSSPRRRPGHPFCVTIRTDLPINSEPTSLLQKASPFPFSSFFQFGTFFFLLFFLIQTLHPEWLKVNSGVV